MRSVDPFNPTQRPTDDAISSLPRTADLAADGFLALSCPALLHAFETTLGATDVGVPGVSDAEARKIGAMAVLSAADGSC